VGDADLPLYDLEQVYDDEISPLMAKIIEICKKHSMPMVASFQYQNVPDQGPGWCTTILVDHPDHTEGKYPTSEKLWRAAEILKPGPKPFIAAFAGWETTSDQGVKTVHIKRIR
jgi:hypothetical protein